MVHRIILISSLECSCENFPSISCLGCASKVGRSHLQRWQNVHMQKIAHNPGKSMFFKKLKLPVKMVARFGIYDLDLPQPRCFRACPRRFFFFGRNGLILVKIGFLAIKREILTRSRWFFLQNTPHEILYTAVTLIFGWFFGKVISSRVKVENFRIFFFKVFCFLALVSEILTRSRWLFFSKYSSQNSLSIAYPDDPIKRG